MHNGDIHSMQLAASSQKNLNESPPKGSKGK